MAGRAAGKREQEGWGEVHELSLGMELVAPTPTMHMTALSGIGPERITLQLEECQGKEADQAQWRWAELPGAVGSPSGTPDFMSFAPDAKHGSSDTDQEQGARGKFTIHWSWLKVSINISMSASNSIVPLACGEGFTLKALKS